MALLGMGLFILGSLLPHTRLISDTPVHEIPPLLTAFTSRVALLRMLFFAVATALAVVGSVAIARGTGWPWARGMLIGLGAYLLYVVVRLFVPTWVDPSGAVALGGYALLAGSLLVLLGGILAPSRSEGKDNRSRGAALSCVVGAVALAAAPLLP